MYSTYVKLLSKWFNILFHFLVNILQYFVKNNKKTIVIEQLVKFDSNTLGKALYNCLKKHGLDIIPVFDTHDIKHILLGYKMTIIDEILMQCYLIGNGNRSLVSIGIATLGLHFPHLYKTMHLHYIQGKKAKNINYIPLQDILHENIECLRHVYQIKFMKNSSY